MRRDQPFDRPLFDETWFRGTWGGGGYHLSDVDRGLRGIEFPRPQSCHSKTAHLRVQSAVCSTKHSPNHRTPIMPFRWPSRRYANPRLVCRDKPRNKMQVRTPVSLLRHLPLHNANRDSRTNPPVNYCTPTPASKRGTHKKTTEDHS